MINLSFYLNFLNYSRPAQIFFDYVKEKNSEDSLIQTGLKQEHESLNRFWDIQNHFYWYVLQNDIARIPQYSTPPGINPKKLKTIVKIQRNWRQKFNPDSLFLRHQYKIHKSLKKNPLFPTGKAVPLKICYAHTEKDFKFLIQSLNIWINNKSNKSLDSALAMKYAKDLIINLMEGNRLLKFNHFYLIDSNQRLLGVCAFRILNMTNVDICILSTSPQNTRENGILNCKNRVEGVGIALIQEIVHLAKYLKNNASSKSCSVGITLHSANSSSFYKKIGFIQNITSECQDDLILHEREFYKFLTNFGGRILCSSSAKIKMKHPLK